MSMPGPYRASYAGDKPGWFRLVRDNQTAGYLTGNTADEVQELVSLLNKGTHFAAMREALKEARGFLDMVGFEDFEDEQDLGPSLEAMKEKWSALLAKAEDG